MTKSGLAMHIVCIKTGNLHVSEHVTLEMLWCV